MSLEVYALASGSSGNSILIAADGDGLLIDAGISSRRLMSAMKAKRLHPCRINGVLITHEHDDHTKGIQRICAGLRAPLVANRATLGACAERMDLPAARELSTGDETQLGPFLVRSFSVSHDAADPVGYVIEHGGKRIFYATDCGCPLPGVREAMRRANLCILESNHDLDWLWRGPYPPHMKARVASDTGHLSNYDAASMLAERLDQDGPAVIWLAHLSAVNNSPSLARKSVTVHLQQSTKTLFNLDIALRDQPSVVWKSGQTAIQASLF